MIAVVTGASGFVGRNLVTALLAVGHDVRCLVRAAGGRPQDDLVTEVVDFEDPDSLARSKSLEGADVVFHLAAATTGVTARDFHRANVIPTESLLTALRTRGSAPRFVYVSSQAAAGPAASPDRPVTERDVPQPVEEYGRSKLAAERAVQRAADRIPTTIVRPCAVFGPFDKEFFRLFRAAQYGVIAYPGVKNHWLSLLHVNDVVTGLIAAGENVSAVGKIFFLAPPQPVRWSDLGRAIEATVGRPAHHLDVPGSAVRAAALLGDLVARVTGAVPLLNSNKAELTRHAHWVCSGERAVQELGFVARQILPDAVRATYFWYLQSGWLGDSRRTDGTAA